MKKLSFVFILAGILIILYPSLNREYNDYQAQKVLDEWQESMDGIDSLETVETSNEKLSNESDDESKKNNNRSILKIDKIDLYMPVLKEATDENLNISLSQMNHTAEPGQVGNFAVAGHRSYTYGRHFNRLDEIEKGDILEVETAKEDYKYKVDETFVIEPDELWVLENKDDIKEITLITCTPIKVATHRLIVKGHLVE